MQLASLFSGSSGNSVLVSGGSTKILVDAGLSGITIESELKKLDVTMEEIDAILVTHEHSDHIKGVGVLSRRFGVPIYANDGTWAGMEQWIGKIKPENRRVLSEGLAVGALEVEPFETPHDSVSSLGFCFYHKGKKATVMTDCGHVSDCMLAHALGSDAILMESNHDIDMLVTGGYPYYLKQRIKGERGHLSNVEAAKLAAILANRGTRCILLGHLSNENNTPKFAYEESARALGIMGAEIGRDIMLAVAGRNGTSGIYEV